MQFNTFELGEELKLSFNLNISGTSAQPSEVRVVLGNQLKLQSTARLNNGGEWEVALPILPDLFTQGDVSLQIEVIINGKLFTPVKQRVTITGSTVSVNAHTTIPEPVIVPAPSEEPNFGSVEKELVKPKLDLSTIISQADLLAASTRYEEKQENTPISSEPIKEEIKPKKKIKFEKPIIEHKEPTKLQLDLTEFANLIEPTEIPIVQQSLQEEISKVKVSTGNFRIQKTKIVSR